MNTFPGNFIIEPTRFGMITFSPLTLTKLLRCISKQLIHPKRLLRALVRSGVKMYEYRANPACCGRERVWPGSELLSKSFIAPFGAHEMPNVQRDPSTQTLWARWIGAREWTATFRAIFPAPWAARDVIWQLCLIWIFCARKRECEGVLCSAQCVVFNWGKVWGQ